MSKVLNLSLELALPLNAVTEKLAWLGRTGSGKTYGAMKLAELMLNAGAQIGALDPVGVWRALRVPVAKDGASFEVVVFGGLYGDLPLEPTEAAGHLVADLVCDRRLSFVLDVSQFIPNEQQRFVKAFADRFFHLKKSKPSAVHLFMEECQEFIPENPSGLEAMTLGAMQRLWKLGRNFGIGGSLISQRPQEIAKKALNMSGTLFAFQMTGPQERKAVKAWVADHGVAVDIESVLQKLEIGQPHVESPTFLGASKTIRILPRITADLSSTPEVGVEKASSRRPLTPIDIEQLKTSMAATIERAKAEDPKELRARIRQLEQELKRGRGPVPVPSPKTVTKTVEKRTFRPGEINGAFVMLGRLLTLAHKFQERHDSLIKALMAAGIRGVNDQTGEPIMAEPVTRDTQRGAAGRTLAADGRSRAAVPQHVPAPRAPRESAGNGKLPKGERAVLIAAAQYGTVTREQLSVLTGYKRSARDTYLQRLRAAGYLEFAGPDDIRPTEAGKEALGSYEELPVGDALREHWLQRLPKGEARVLSVVCEVGSEGLTREMIDEATGYKRSARDTYLQRLGARRLILREGGRVIPSSELFG